MKRFHTKLALLLSLAFCLLLAAACGSGGSGGPPSGSERSDPPAAAVEPPVQNSPAPGDGAAAQTDDPNAAWAAVVKKAEEEGTLSIVIPLGEAYRAGIAHFQAAYPNIELVATQLHPRDFVPRIKLEREQGQYLWDAYVGGPDVDVYGLGKTGVLDPIKPELRPDIVDDSHWFNGFDAGFSDTDKKHVYNFVSKSSFIWGVNRDFISVEDLPNTDALWDPKFKGKIAWNDPRRSGSGVNVAAMFIDKYGEDALRELFEKQEVVANSDQRQLIEWSVRGTYPIAIGIVDRDLKTTFQSQGVGMKIEPIPWTGRKAAIPASGSVSLINNAPNPNARKVFVNWLLSKEGQTALITEIQEVSRRRDVPVVRPDLLPPEGEELLNTQAEDFESVRKRANEIANEAIK